MRFANNTLLNAAATRALTSDVLDLQQIVNLGLHLIATGTPTGSLLIEVSNDLVNSGDKVANWGQYQAPTALSGAALSTPVSIPNICFRWLRVRYTFSSGSGQIVVNYCSHGV